MVAAAGHVRKGEGKSRSQKNSCCCGRQLLTASSCQDRKTIFASVRTYVVRRSRRRRRNAARATLYACNRPQLEYISPFLSFRDIIRFRDRHIFPLLGVRMRELTFRGFAKQRKPGRVQALKRFERTACLSCLFSTKKRTHFTVFLLMSIQNKIAYLDLV